jgi:flagellar biosynthesis chaperone FliJ
LKKFSFTLERVREWREEQIAVEQLKLEQIATELRKIEERAASLDREMEANETAVLRSPSVDSTTLGALQGFRHFVRNQRTTVSSTVADCRERLQAQTLRVLEAQRNARLLDKLKLRALKTWQAACDKEVEEQAAESYLAKWNREL